MAFAMDIPMAFAIQWVLPCDWAMYSTMGFAQDIPLGFAMRWALPYELAQSVKMGFAIELTIILIHTLKISFCSNYHD